MKKKRNTNFDTLVIFFLLLLKREMMMKKKKLMRSKNGNEWMEGIVIVRGKYRIFERVIVIYYFLLSL